MGRGSVKNFRQLVALPRGLLAEEGLLMMHIRWTAWRRDVLVAGLASLFTIFVLVPIGWAAVRDHRQQAEAARRMAQAAALLIEQQRDQADQQRSQAQRKLVAEAVEFAGFAERSDAEVLRVTSAAVAPEIPAGAHVLIDKKPATFAVGDIVIYRVGDSKYLGRVLAVDRTAGRLTVGRNGEPDRPVALGDVIGRGVLNTR
jgi:hypothetical protein